MRLRAAIRLRAAARLRAAGLAFGASGAGVAVHRAFFIAPMRCSALALG